MDWLCLGRVCREQDSCLKVCSIATEQKRVPSLKDRVSAGSAGVSCTFEPAEMHLGSQLSDLVGLMLNLLIALHDGLRVQPSV